MKKGEIKQLIKEEVLSFVSEGINDPSILKSFFLAGGPGSGKSYVTDNIFGLIPTGFETVSYSSGLKVIRSDNDFERILHKMKIDPKDLYHLLDPNKNPEMSNKIATARQKIKNITDKRHDLYKEGRLGLIIDGTGRDFLKVQKHKKELESIGYDTHMIFVNTSLDVAKQRNLKRKRSLPDEMITKMWEEVQNNLGKYQKLFGNKYFHIVDNSSTSNDSIKQTEKVINQSLKEPIENPIGKKWIQQNKK
jgi:predicted kinase